MTDPMQLSLVDGIDAKRVGIETALEHAAPDWRSRFDAALVTLARARVPFTSEDVLVAVGLPRGQIATNQNNAVGAMMNAAARRRLIRKTGRRVQAQRPSSHGAELTEWVGT